MNPDPATFYGLPALSAESPQGSSWFTNNRVNTWTYDEMGNLQVSGMTGRNLAYDAENRIAQVNAGPIGYTYDGDGRRVTKTTPGPNSTTYTTIYVYDAFGQLAQEYSNAPSTDSGTSYMTVDHLGSTRLITDSTGGVKKRFDYLPFGEEILAGYGNRTTAMDYNDGSSVTMPDKQSLKFTSKEHDAETGLDYFGARYFSGAQGRFTSPDWSAMPQPVPYANLSDPQTLNLYGYVRNNPLSQPDIDGHQEVAQEVIEFGRRIIQESPTKSLKAIGYIVIVGGYGIALAHEAGERIGDAINRLLPPAPASTPVPTAPQGWQAYYPDDSGTVVFTPIQQSSNERRLTRWAGGKLVKQTDPKSEALAARGQDAGLALKSGSRHFKRTTGTAYSVVSLPTRQTTPSRGRGAVTIPRDPTETCSQRALIATVDQGGSMQRQPKSSYVIRSRPTHD